MRTNSYAADSGTILNIKVSDQIQIMSTCSLFDKSWDSGAIGADKYINIISMDH